MVSVLESLSLGHSLCGFTKTLRLHQNVATSPKRCGLTNARFVKLELNHTTNKLLVIDTLCFHCYYNKQGHNKARHFTAQA